MKKREQAVSFVGVVLLALMLPGILKLTNSVVRYFVGAEGRLAAIGVETDKILGPLPAPWKGLAQGGDKLKTFLDSTSTEIANIGTEYIRIDHIYDGFEVVSRGQSGLVFDWTKLDQLVDKIVATGAKPFFSMSYIPEAIATGDIVSSPKNWNEWSLLVKKTIEHYSGELQLNDVYYEVYNEPDLFGGWKIGGAKDYRNLYRFASLGASAAENVLPFKIGGPATTGLYKNWVDNFFPYILENNLRLDFFSWHRYDLDAEKYIEDIKSVDTWIDRHPYFAHVEKIISEMGPQSDRGGENDTKLGAAHLVYVSRELMFKVKYGMSFAVDGDWGIVGKPRYEALLLLSMLGSQRTSVTGEGSWVRAIAAKKNGVNQVLLVNYDPKGIHNELVPVSFLNFKGNNFRLRRTMYTSNKMSVFEESVATTEAVLQSEVPMSPNSLVLLELVPIQTLPTL